MTTDSVKEIEISVTCDACGHQGKAYINRATHDAACKELAERWRRERGVMMAVKGFASGVAIGLIAVLAASRL